jgi:hypothetical protein
MNRHLARRLLKLEHQTALARERRVVIRFERPGSEMLSQPNDYIDEYTKVISVRFVGPRANNV